MRWCLIDYNVWKNGMVLKMEWVFLFVNVNGTNNFADLTETLGNQCLNPDCTIKESRLNNRKEDV